MPVREPAEVKNHFTPRVQQVLALARKEAEHFNHNFVGTEHLLLGLLCLGHGIAVNVLKKVGVELEVARQEVEKQVGTGPEQKSYWPISYTPRVKKVLALAAKEAKAPRVLKNLGVDLGKTQEEILRLLIPRSAAEVVTPIRETKAGEVPGQ